MVWGYSHLTPLTFSSPICKRRHLPHRTLWRCNTKTHISAGKSGSCTRLLFPPSLKLSISPCIISGTTWNWTRTLQTLGYNLRLFPLFSVLRQGLTKLPMQSGTHCTAQAVLELLTLLPQLLVWLSCAIRFILHGSFQSSNDFVELLSLQMSLTSQRSQF